MIPWCVAVAMAAPELIAVGDVLGDRGGAPRAVLVEQGRITAVVPVARARRLAGPDTTWLEAPLVTAGFVDAHGHPDWLAMTLSQVDLTGAATYAEALARVGAAGGEGVLRGHGWDQNDWPDAPEGGWPLAADLAQVASGRAVALTRIDGHAVWVSPELLAGLPAEDPVGGQIVRDAGGAPTGVLVDAAAGLVALPEPDVTPEALEGALSRLAAAGLTGVHAMSVSDAALEALGRLARDGRLPVHVWAYVAADGEAARALLRDGPWRSGRLEVVGIKHFVDGALGSRGAWLHAPYADRPDHLGLPQVAPDALVTWLAAEVEAALRARVQVAVHAIGDAGVDAVLDAFTRARRAVPEAADVPLRVEHAQVLSPGALERFREAGAIASMQPTHATSDMPWAEARLGPERVARAYAWRDVLDAGVTLAFGSDFPVERHEPALGVWAAVTRADAAGAPPGGWRPEQRLTLEEAAAAFTAGAAAAVAAPERGRLEAGAWADLSLWERQDGRLAPVATVVDGQLVWRR